MEGLSATASPQFLDFFPILFAEMELLLFYAYRDHLHAAFSQAKANLIYAGFYVQQTAYGTGNGGLPLDISGTNP